MTKRKQKEDSPGRTAAAGAAPEDKLVWHDIREFGVEGKGWQDTEHFYDRLPARAKGTVNDLVWGLSHDSAGMCARFVTDAPRIHARWTLRKEALAMPHMPATGVSGLDLYVRIGRDWRPAGAGCPEKFPANSACLLSGIVPASRQYILYLPLYNGVESVEIGVPRGASLRCHGPTSSEDRAVSRRHDRARPICFYGTSITQGGCASRPGMAYAAILGRWLDRPILNLGFSGSAKAEPEIASLLAELDPGVYVLDCLPNLASAGMVHDRVVPLVRTIRAARPKTPIVLVECIRFARPPLVRDMRRAWQTKNAALRIAFRRLRAEGARELHYVRADDLLGGDGEATVDGVHPTDLGFLRIAQAMAPVLGPLV